MSSTKARSVVLIGLVAIGAWLALTNDGGARAGFGIFSVGVLLGANGIRLARDREERRQPRG